MMDTGGAQTERITLFALPYAGGTANVYRRLAPYLSASVDLVPIDIPGHGQRIASPPLGRMEELVAFIVERINEHHPGIYALFGHSFGAHLAFLAAREMRKTGQALPVHLLLSGKAGPEVPFRHKDIHKLPEKEFLEVLRGYGGIPDQFFDEPELIELFLPVLKADFEAMSRYRFDKEEPLPVPITVLHGEKDLYPSEKYQSWAGETSKRFRILTFSGNHFFLFDHLAEIGHVVSEQLAEAYQNFQKQTAPRT